MRTPISAHGSPWMSRRRLDVTGVVQGVGFRPFVFRLAETHNLSGFVLNTAEGVVIEVEGKSDALERFTSDLQHRLPPLARIDTLGTTDIAPRGDTAFVIKESDAKNNKTAFLPPDMALCDRCLTDMRDPKSRFFGYPFTTCTDCGPRYTIIRTVPYDRPNTSMAPFAMCPECEAEYHDPRSRRYHAQPLSCPNCGPTLRYHAADCDAAEGETAIKACAEAITQGKIVAVKGMGGFHLVCDATDETAVALLRTRKNRPAKPLAVMYPDIDTLENETRLSEAERRLLLSKERPIVLTERSGNSRITPGVAPGITRLGVFLPYTPIHHLLFDHLDTPVVATSANMSDEPIITDADTLRERLGSVIDAYLDYDREIVNACDDSVVQVAGGRPQLLRMGRGYAPLSLKLPRPVARPLLAVGANQKNSIALAFGDNAVFSPHIGDLGSIEAFEYFERTLATLQRFYAVTPEAIVHDPHPGYAATRWTKSRNLPTASLQHHRAHIEAVRLENGYDGPLLGFAFDGTGYGEDGTIWGAEVFLSDGGELTRRYHLRPFRLLGGEAAVKEPRRAALALLFGLFELEPLLEMDIPTLKAFDEEEIRKLHLMWSKSLQAPLASSAGRLFDAAASLCGAVQRLSYEGESGLILESLYDANITGYYPVVLDGEVIDTDPLITALLEDVKAADPALVATRFINTLAELVITIAGRTPEIPVALGGGVFQNRTLVDLVSARLDEAGIRLLPASRFPVNDGGIAAGQIRHTVSALLFSKDEL